MRVNEFRIEFSKKRVGLIRSLRLQSSLFSNETPLAARNEESWAVVASYLIRQGQTRK